MVESALCLPVSLGIICPAAPLLALNALPTTIALVALHRRRRAPAAPLLHPDRQVLARVWLRLRQFVRRGNTWTLATTRASRVRQVRWRGATHRRTHGAVLRSLVRILEAIAWAGST